MSRSTIAVSLRDARENSGLSQEKVVAQLRPSPTVKTLRRWEQAGRVPEARREWYLPQLAELYGVPAESLNGKTA